MLMCSVHRYGTYAGGIQATGSRHQDCFPLDTTSLAGQKPDKVCKAMQHAVQFCMDDVERQPLSSTGRLSELSSDTKTAAL